ncbi:MAG: FGGY-family carbohydrate kinase [Bacteroidota bacterium]
MNGFAHVNYTNETPNVGILLCVNGAGIQHNWMRQNAGNKAYDYPTMEAMASKVPIGSDGISVLPFGNNAERILENKDIGSSIHNLQFSRHGQAHLFRAGLEGIAFAFVYGLEIMKEMGMDFQKMRVGNDNLFQSKVFAETITSLTNSTIEVVDTTGAIGAAKAAGVEIGAFSQLEEALGQAPVLFEYAPKQNEAYLKAYAQWKGILERSLA